MTYYRAYSAKKRLYFSERVLSIAQSDADIQEAVARFGQGPEQLAIGLGFIAEANHLMLRRRKLYADQLLATKDCKAVYQRVRRQFVADRRLIRSVLEQHRAAFESFELNTRLPNQRETIIKMAEHFYKQILAKETVQAALLEHYYLDAETVVESRQQGLSRLVEAMQDQQVKRARAQLATVRLREAMARLDDWMTTFIGVARQAFRKERKQLEKLGLAVKAD